MAGVVGRWAGRGLSGSKSSLSRQAGQLCLLMSWLLLQSPLVCHAPLAARLWFCWPFKLKLPSQRPLTSTSRYYP